MRILYKEGNKIVVTQDNKLKGVLLSVDIKKYLNPKEKNHE